MLALLERIDLSAVRVGVNKIRDVGTRCRVQLTRDLVRRLSFGAFASLVHLVRGLRILFPRDDRVATEAIIESGFESMILVKQHFEV